ncbi:MAG: hypothetical protein EOS27_08050 [Mesorhizobium sp.]|nr:MAG: hypothetical protein EOS27_08050 [Mesorhizobium sp.]TIX22895.1 MAG: hypothetical protein E5V35_24260 [Mesorhizobium sp.]
MGTYGPAFDESSWSRHSAATTPPVLNDREHLPLLIIGKEHAIETLVRLALDDIAKARGCFIRTTLTSSCHTAPA